MTASRWQLSGETEMASGLWVMGEASTSSSWSGAERFSQYTSLPLLPCVPNAACPHFICSHACTALCSCFEASTPDAPLPLPLLTALACISR